MEWLIERRKTVAWIFLFCLVASSSLYFVDKKEAKWESERTEADWAHIANARSDLSDLSGRELLLLRDSTYEYVAWANKGSDEIWTISKMGSSRNDKDITRNSFPYSVLKIVHLGDPAYPEAAKAFLLQE